MQSPEFFHVNIHCQFHDVSLFTVCMCSWVDLCRLILCVLHYNLLPTATGILTNQAEAFSNEFTCNLWSYTVSYCCNKLLANSGVGRCFDKGGFTKRGLYKKGARACGVPTLAVNCRASVVRGEEAGRFRYRSSWHVHHCCGCLRSAVDTSNVDIQVTTSSFTRI